MQQFQFEYKNLEQLRKELEKIRQWCKVKVTSNILFLIYSESTDDKQIEKICGTIKEELPSAQYAGCSSNGNIASGHIANAPITIVCTVFEYVSTKVEVLQYELSDESANDVAARLIRFVDMNPWVKAVQLLVTIRGMSMTNFCEALYPLRGGVQIFGGGAFNPDINNDTACVFSSAGKCDSHSVAFILYGGNDLNVMSMHITGWKPLGRWFKVTKARGGILYELDGRPAYEAYYKYLNIQNNEHFFRNTLEFPFLFQLHGIDILRAPIASNPDGSLTMTSDMAEDVIAKIAYGDPHTILDSVRRDCQAVRQFQPEIIQVFSCAGRRTFWGQSEISKETLPFQTIAPTSGFYTSSEFLRTDGHVNQHNVTLVIAAMREGGVSESEATAFEMQDESFSGKVSMINRLATFIEAATSELREANEKLAMAAVTDGLTGLYNRAEIQKRIVAKCAEEDGRFSLVMIDIDNFKFVNDTYGHAEGDNVIIGLSNRIKDVVRELAPAASAGRWGGEEFMILLPNFSEESAEFFAEKLRKSFAYSTFPSVGQGTISLGVTVFRPGESSDSVCIRVDNALYSAKRGGKNRVVAL